MENTAATSLYDLLVTRDFEPEILDSAGKAVSNPADAELFSFDWKTNGKNYGTVVVLFGQDNELEVYYGDNLGRGMDGEHRGDWYDFLAQLKNFAARNLMSFELNNINRLKFTMQGLAAIKEGLFEGYYGRKNISYSDQPKQTRLMIKHDRDLGEGEARYRAIESLFVETADGERFRVPSRSLMHGRMLARHIAEGGKPYDALGMHINEIINELATLSRFVRASKNRQLGSSAQSMIDEARKHYHNLQSKARRMISQRGYVEVRDQFDPAAVTESTVAVDEIREMFMETNIDPRIEQALPVLAKLKGRSMKEADEFENWARDLTEGTWALPRDPQSIDQLEKLLSQPLPVGPDATNATEQLYDIFGDDELFDRLGDLAEKDAAADARDIVRDRLAELGIKLPADGESEPAAISEPITKSGGMGEDLDVDGVMMTRPSNMSSESQEFDLERLRRLALM